MKYITHPPGDFAVHQVSFNILQRVVNSTLGDGLHTIDKGFDLICAGIRNTAQSGSVPVHRVRNFHCFLRVTNAAPPSSNDIENMVRFGAYAKRLGIKSCPLWKVLFRCHGGFMSNESCCCCCCCSQ